MMDNGSVLFFAGDEHGWWVKNIEQVSHGFRGFVPDGCFNIDYISETSTINICVGRHGLVDWLEPTNIIKNRTLVETIPVVINSNDYLEIQQWAMSQRWGNGKNNNDSR